MSLKHTILATMICLSAVLGSTSVFIAHASPKRHRKIKENQWLKSIQHQVDELFSEQHRQALALAHNKIKHSHLHSSRCVHELCAHQHGSVMLGTYFKKDDDYAGGNLISSLPSVRTDIGVLKRNYSEQKEAKSLGLHAPSYPRLTVGASMEAAILDDHMSNAAARKGSFDLNSMNFMALFQATEWITAYVNTMYNTDDLNKNGKLGFKFSLFSGFITIGNLSRSPFFFTIGEMRVPFGRHTSNLAERAPVTFAARTRVKAAEIGFQQTGSNALQAEAYVYQGLAVIRGDQHPYHWGASLGYHFKINHEVSGEVGASYISNFTDASTVQGVFKNNVAMKPIVDPHHPPTATGDFSWMKAVPAENAWSVLSLGPVALRAEYTQTATNFATQDMRYLGHGARPKLLYLEEAYNFHIGPRSSAVGVGYEHTWQAVSLGLPEDRYTVFYNITPVRHTLLTIEYAHGINYPGNASLANPALTTMSPDTRSGLGKTDNTVDAVFDIYF